MALAASVWGEFIGELSREGGPRAPRANALSTSLFNKFSDASAGGHLIRLGALLGVIRVDRDGRGVLSKGRLSFTRGNVVTTEEEGHLTNFIALSDYFFAVDMSWDNYRNNFFQKDLGTGLLTLERQLSVLEESINEVYAAMDSVFVDQAERLAILIDFENYKDVSVEDFLSWVASFASTEAPALIREGGKWGVEAILPTADTLSDLMGQFVDLIRATDEDDDDEDDDGGVSPSGTVTVAADPSVTAEGKSPGLPPAFNHGRVLNPLGEVRMYLGQIAATARKITGS